MARKKKNKIPKIVAPRLPYGGQREQRGITISKESWDLLMRTVGGAGGPGVREDGGGASNALEISWLILHGLWFGNADPNIEHNNDPLHRAVSLLESVAWYSDRDIDDLIIRLLAMRELLGMIRDQRLQIEEMKPNIYAE